MAALKREYGQTKSPGDVMDGVWWLRRYYFGKPSEEWYLGLFPPKEGRQRGEITPRYSTLDDEEIARVKRLLPGARIFYTMRDPIERAWSQVRFTGVEMTEPEMIEFIDSPRQHLRNSYDRTLELWERHFPEDQFLTLFYEDLLTEPLPYMTRLCEFLKVDPSKLDTSLMKQKFNVSRSQSMPPGIRSYLEEKYGPMKQKLAERFPRTEELWGAA